MMTRLMLRLMLPAAVVCLLAVGVSLAAGATRAHVPVAVFLHVTPGTDLGVTWVDSALHTRYARTFTSARLPDSIDNCRLLFVGMQGVQPQLVGLDLHTQAYQTYLPRYTSFSEALWLPDAERLWVRLTRRRISHYLLLNTQTAARVEIAMPPLDTQPSTYTAWSPDGRYGLVYLQIMGSAAYVGLVDSHTGSAIPLTAAGGMLLGAWSEDSQRLALQDSRASSITLLNPAGEVLAQRTLPDVLDALPPLWLNAHELLLFARPQPGDPAFIGYRWSPAEDRLQPTALRLPGERGEGTGSYAPDGTRLYYNAAGQSIIVNVADGRRLSAVESRSYRAVWSPDSRYLVEYAPDSGTLFLHDTAAERLTRLPGWRTYPVGHWSPDQRYLIVFDRSTGTLGLIQPDSPQPVAQMTLRLPGAYSAALCYAGG
ncbi:MAG: hypothetical protein MUE40_14420 [Anaerolineae bacterium]|nr:hypothetical protein [Anaerolineae bacterium]